MLKAHKIYYRDKKANCMGFQYNYPYEGCVFDIGKQRYLEYKKGLSDEELKDDFDNKILSVIVDRTVLDEIANWKWKDIVMLPTNKI